MTTYTGVRDVVTRLAMLLCGGDECEAQKIFDRRRKDRVTTFRRRTLTLWLRRHVLAKRNGRPMDSMAIQRDSLRIDGYDPISYPLICSLGLGWHHTTIMAQMREATNAAEMSARARKLWEEYEHDATAGTPAETA